MKAVIIGGGHVARDIQTLCVTKGIDTERLEADPQSWPRINDADWICEASGLNFDDRRGLLAAIARGRGPDSLVTADESVVPRAQFADGMEPGLRSHFAIAHVFVPMRKLRLVELVTGGEMMEDTSSRLEWFLRERLDRHVVKCPDMPGFIANRIGLFLVAKGVQLAAATKLPRAELDAATRALLGLPRTGIFGLAELIGHDVMIAIAVDLKTRLPKEDAWQACDLRSLAIHDMTPGPAFVDKNGDAAAFVRTLAGEVGAYARHVADVTGTPIRQVEDIMRAGFGWSKGIPGQTPNANPD